MDFRCETIVGYVKDESLFTSLNSDFSVAAVAVLLVLKYYRHLF